MTKTFGRLGPLAAGIYLPFVLLIQIFGLIAGTIGLFVRSNSLAKIARDRDRFAELVSTGNAPPGARHSLFLRPFFIDAKINHGKRDARSDAYWLRGRSDRLEALVADAMDDVMPVLMLGNRKNDRQGGAVRVRDSDWKKTVETLAETADLIFVVPLAQPGTAWEIVMISERGLVSKCVFLVPAQSFVGPRLSGARFAFGVAEMYRHSRAALENSTVTWPDLGAEGGMFVFDENGSPNVVRGFPSTSDEFYLAVRRLLDRGSADQRAIRFYGG